MNVYIVNGYPQAGKDTFVHSCARKINRARTYRVKSFSTVDPIKAMLLTYGWDGNKTPKSRKAMAEIKQICVKYNFIESYIDKIINDGYEEDVIFIFSREPKEIKEIKEQYGAKTIFIKRTPTNFLDLSNDSDKNVENFDYDFYIDNTGDFNQLDEQILIFLKKEKLI